ncbi:MAG: hypothetical protein M3Z87_12105, partial [Lactobacillus sp.]|nr:hypothetical protein [Lactobacillus sp.]
MGNAICLNLLKAG